jgi:hypothetical protein
MDKQSVTEILARHADQLNSGKKLESGILPTTIAVNQDEVASLLAIATRLKGALKPVSIPARFRTHLRDELEMAAQHRTSQKFLIEQHDSAWGWLIGAAALGSAAGLIAFAIRSKQSRQSIAHVVPETAQTN